MRQKKVLTFAINYESFQMNADEVVSWVKDVHITLLVYWFNELISNPII